MRTRARDRIPRIAGTTILLLLAALPGVLAGDAPAGTSSAERIRSVIGTGDFAVARIGLPEPSREAFRVELVHGDRERSLLLRRHSLRAPGFRVRAYREGGTVEVEPPVPATYRGVVAGETESAVIARFDEDGLRAKIFSPGAAPLVVRPLSEIEPGAAAADHVLYEDDDWRDVAPEPGSSEIPAPSPGSGELLRPEALGSIGDTQYLAEIAFDVDFYYYELKGSSIPESVAAVEEILNQIDYLYARDVMITYQLTDIIVRTEPYYFPFSGQDFLHRITNEWSMNQDHIPHDLAHLMTNRPGIEYSGVAGMASVCGPQAYGFSYDDVRVVAHEIAHNWAGNHCLDRAPCNVMCGGCLLITPNLRETITEFRDVLTCLDAVGAYPEPLPPYATPDRLEVTREELAVMGPTLIDVLGNDHDGNLDPLRIESFDALSAEGAAIALSQGTGPDGRDQLLYTPPGWVYGGPDRFTYSVGDGTGLESRGAVTITVTRPGLAGHWKLDDASGTVAADASGMANHAELAGDPAWTSGRFGGGVELDGEDDYLTAPPLSLYGNHVTMTAWLNWAGDQEHAAGIISCWDQENRAGMRLSPSGQLQYHWGESLQTWGWWSNLYLPVGEWVFAALVVEPDQATMYMYDGELHSSVNEFTHEPEKFSGVLTLGARAEFLQSDRFAGRMDDVRVYGRALGAGEIAEVLEDAGDKACNPDPPDNGRVISSSIDLSWSAGAGAVSHDVYFGYDYVALRDATTASPEYAGNTANPFYHPPVALAVGHNYYWRIDEVTEGGWVQGDVWLFKVVGPYGHWRLDETSGTIAEDEIGGRDGTYMGTPVLGEPGATAHLGGSITLDGFGDYVEVHGLDLHSNHVTIAGWVRREIHSGQAMGVVASNDLETAAGLYCGIGGELGYRWAGRYQEWESGLMAPLGQWVFAALVVRPGQATVYMGENGNLKSATNVDPHPPQAFAGPTDFGCDALGYQGFRGGLDDIWVYNAALTGDDIGRIYARGLERIEAGSVPDGRHVPGEPLRLTKTAGGTVMLDWSPSCRSTDADYAVYQGTIGAYTVHAPATCTTQGELSFGLTPQAGSRYFIVVPLGTNSEGSYGVDSGGAPRPQGNAACFPQAMGECD